MYEGRSDLPLPAHRRVESSLLRWEDIVSLGRDATSDSEFPAKRQPDLSDFEGESMVSASPEIVDEERPPRGRPRVKS